MTTEQIKQFERMLEDNKDIFTKGARPSKAVGVTHRIELESPYVKPVNSSPERPSQEERNAIREQIGEMLNNGVIKESRSPWSSRIVLIRKKDGKLRFCIDYRRLNKLTKSDIYPLPRIDDSLAALEKGHFFTTLGLFARYWQIQMEEESKDKTAFISESGLYQFEVMPFGLKTAGATFQRFMDAVLAGLKWKSLLVYLGDIVIFSSTFEQHILDVNEVFNRLRTAGFEFDYEIHHKPGKLNTRADMLSRLPQLDNNDNIANYRVDNLILNYGLEQKEQSHMIHTLKNYTLTTNPELIRREQLLDEKLNEIIQEIKENRNVDDFIVKNDLLYFKEDNQLLLVIPDQLRHQVLEDYHNHPLGGHL